MKHKWTKRLAAVLLTAAMLFNGGMIFAEGIDNSAEKASEDAIEDKVLFSTSFEKSENGNLLVSTPDGDHLSNVVNTEYLSQGEGLAILYETVSGSTDYLGSECKYNLFDDKTSTKFLASGSKIYVQFALEEAAVVSSYDVASANDEASRDPAAWTLYGSADGKTWTELDSRAGVVFGKRQETKKFGFDNKTEYKWYKFEVTNNMGASLTQFSTLHLFEEKADAGDGVFDGTAIRVLTETIKGMEELGYNASQNKAALFDGSVGTKFISAVPTGFVSVQLSAPIVLVEYKLGTGDDNGTHPQRSPKSWVLYGSTDGSTWVELDRQSDVTMTGNSKLHSFPVENEVAYDHYKLDITANGGLDGTGRDIIQLSEWQFVQAGGEEDKPADDGLDTLQQIDTSAVAGTASNDGGEGNLMLFDGDTSSKLCVVANTLWVSVKLSAPAAVNMYKIASVDENRPQRDPKSWILYGSTDGNNWVKLDERQNEEFADRCTYYTYTFLNDTEYSYYKLDVLSNHGKDDLGMDVLQFSEWELYVTAREIEIPDPEDKEPAPTVDKSTVESSAPVDGGEGVLNVFDGNENTKLCVKGKEHWITFALTEAMVIKGYTITSANDHETRNPKDWTFYGSTDGENWVKLDVRAGVLFSGYFEKQAFAFVNEKAYRYFKLDITANCGNDYTQFADLTLLTNVDGLIKEKLPGMVTEPAFGPISTECNYPGAWSGLSCLAVYGEQTDTKDTYARNVIYKGLSIPVTKNTNLSYVIFPGLFNVNSYDYEYTSCRVIIDLAFSDGTYLSELGAVDQYGSKMTPTGQVEGECLYTIQWNYVESCIGDVAAGKTIEKICVYFDMPEAHDASRFVTFFDDLVIEDKAPVVYEHLSDYINILRGTNNDIAFSRGMCTPGVVLPGGFNFFTPVTNPQAATLPYSYQQNGENSPLDSISVLHAPNFWIGSYGSFQFMVNTSVDTSAGTKGITSAQISSSARQSKFTHRNEAPRAHEYSVTLNEGTAASGVTIEVTPTVHGAYVRFTFPKGSDNVNVIFDSLWGSGSLKFGADGKSFTATTNHGPAMYVYGEFDKAYASASVVGTKQGIVSFAEDTTVVTMKLATSFISHNQAMHSLELEIGTDNYDAIFAKAQKEWDDLCGIFEIEGASFNQLTTFYSSLYRLYAFPSLYSENEGTNENPVWTYKSPHSNKKTAGILYTNNGFWDTYRTAWGAYALFTPEKDVQYLNGMVQHYTETGWVPRWLGPGPVNCMVGTSSDIIFADAYLKGIDYNYEEAWNAMLKSASAYASNMTAGGRKENNTAPFLGYIANDKIVNGESVFVGEAYSSSIEGYINDYGLYRMADAMGLTDEAEYYYNRCMQYVLLYNATQGFFMGRSTKGVWSCGQAAFDPAQWNGPMYDFTESVGWMYAFPAVFDGQGLASLHGGAEKLAEKLNKAFDDSYEAMQNVVEIGSVHHEIAEFKEVKMGQYMHSNQPSHHVIYTYAFSSEPYRVQQYTREVLRHVYVGSQIGQGYPGDEDNGEMSGWYIFNALGFYPYAMGSNEYVIGSPLFDKVTIHLENGKDIVIVANNNSDENVYIQSAKLNGKSFDSMFLTHEQLTSGCTIEFEMGSKPSKWGSGEGSAPTSLTEKGKAPTALADLSLASGVKTVTTASAGTANLLDNNSLTYTTIANGDTVTMTSTAPTKISMITLASYKANTAPRAFKLEVSNDGKNWITADERIGLKWQFDNYVQSFSIPENARGAYSHYRLTLSGGTQLAEVEFIGEKATNSLIGFAGYQLAEDGKGLRMIGYTESLAFDSVDLQVSVTGDAKESFSSAVSTVYRTLYGTVDGKRTAVVSTDAKADALMTLDHEYLYGYGVVNLPDGSYTLTIVPTATVGGNTVKGESATLQITVSGGVITVAK